MMNATHGRARKANQRGVKRTPSHPTRVLGRDFGIGEAAECQCMTRARCASGRDCDKGDGPLIASEGAYRREISALTGSFDRLPRESADFLERMVERKKIVRERTLGRLL